MLQLKKICKSYHVGDTITHALNDVSISFRNQEFVAILGPSGSGKTTLLNVVGGLDRYDRGDLIINGKSTKNFKETDWDAYRNNSVGFVFQNYNLISHLSIMDNVELGMNLSGVSATERKKRAADALTQVGLKDQISKNPNQLSGGQMQRVAIARALANNPDILLCDEPTGALDTQTSEQIMKLIKKLSRDRLVIMVTHNSNLAQEYATRIVNFQDGKILNDSNPLTPKDEKDTFKLKRTKMSYWNAIKLSFTNILTKKGRTLLTALASSIGIISIALVLALSNGLQKQIDNTMSRALAKYPVTINQTVTDTSNSQKRNQSDKNVRNTGYITVEKDTTQQLSHQNIISQKYLNYIKSINPNNANNISYQRGVNLNILTRVDHKIKWVQFSPTTDNSQDFAKLRMQVISSIGLGSSVFPTALKKGKSSFLKQNYQLLSGKWPKKATDLVIVIDNKDKLNVNILKKLGLNVKIGDKLKYQNLIGQKFKIIDNDNYYQKLPTGMFIPQKDKSFMYKSSNTTTKTVGVIRPKNENSMEFLSTGIAYSDQLAQNIIKRNKNSQIVKAQINSDQNVMTGQDINANEKKQMLQSIGGSTIPTSIMIYPNDFDAKDKVLII